MDPRPENLRWLKAGADRVSCKGIKDRSKKVPWRACCSKQSQAIFESSYSFARGTAARAVPAGLASNKSDPSLILFPPAANGVCLCLVHGVPSSRTDRRSLQHRCSRAALGIANGKEGRGSCEALAWHLQARPHFLARPAPLAPTGSPSPLAPPPGGFLEG